MVDNNHSHNEDLNRGRDTKINMKVIVTDSYEQRPYEKDYDNKNIGNV